MRNNFKNWTPPTPQHNVPTQWNWVVAYPKNLKIGRYVDIGAFTYINSLLKVCLGDNCQIGSHCSLYTVSTIDNKSGPITLCANSKVGSHSTIMPDITIGENSIVAAHSFVSSNVPANSIYGGVPAKFIRSL